MVGPNSNVNLEGKNSMENELQLLLLRQQHGRNFGGVRESGDLNIINRSGSAPPTVEGAFSSIGGLFRNPNFLQFTDNGNSSNAILTEDEIRSHLAYLSYYYSHENVNPRLPPPLLSREDWRVAQRVQAGGSALGEVEGWRRKNLTDEGGSSSLFTMQPGRAEDELIMLRNAASLTGELRSGLGVRRKSFADIVQLNSSEFAHQKDSKALQQVDYTGYVPGGYVYKQKMEALDNNLSSSLNGVRGNGRHSRSESKDLEKLYLETLLAQEEQQFQSSLLPNYGSLTDCYYGNHAFGTGIPCQGNKLANSLHTTVGSRNLMYQNDPLRQIPSVLSNSIEDSAFLWHSKIVADTDGRFAPALLDDFKNKNRSLELMDVVDHVVEFSTDQRGSRFIQQKLETASVEEKLKFLEHGTESQRKELASQLIGHVLPLSLHMYGCRVIQKIDPYAFLYKNSFIYC